MERTWVIYSLIDPCSGEVRYIGWTTRPRSRLHVHLSNARRGETYYVSRWIARLLSEDKQPIMQIIATGKGAGYAEAEQQWIARYRAWGCRLTNLTDGGDGAIGYRHSAKSKERMSSAKKGKPVSDASRRNLEKGWTTALSPEVRAKIGRAQRGKVVSAETRAKLRTINLGKHHSDKTKAIISEIGRGRRRSQYAIDQTAAWHRGRKRSLTTCQRISDAKKGKPNLKLRGRVFSEETRRQISVAQKARATDPEVYRRRSDAQQRRWARSRQEVAA